MLIKLGADPHIKDRTILNVEKSHCLPCPIPLGLAATGLNRACSVWETRGPAVAVERRVELLRKLDLAAGRELEVFPNRKAVGPFGWDLKLKRLQNLAADQCRGMRWNLGVAPRIEDLRI